MTRNSMPPFNPTTRGEQMETSALGDRHKGDKFTPGKFFARVRRGDKSDCWEWQGPPDNDGYGNVMAYSKHWKAHRLAWVLSVGDIPAGRIICHSCDNRACCNPDHLWLGTQLQNIADRDLKGRHAGSKIRNCPQRHAYTNENTRTDKNGKRHCRACERGRS